MAISFINKGIVIESIFRVTLKNLRGTDMVWALDTMSRAEPSCTWWARTTYQRQQTSLPKLQHSTRIHLQIEPSSPILRLSTTKKMISTLTLATFCYIFSMVLNTLEKESNIIYIFLDKNILIFLFSP